MAQSGQLRLPIPSTRKSGDKKCIESGSLKQFGGPYRQISNAVFRGGRDQLGQQLFHDTEILKAKLIAAEEQKASDFPWQPSIKSRRDSFSGHSLFSADRKEPHADDPLPKCLVWGDIEAILRREECAILEYDLLDSFGGAIRRFLHSFS